jgi:hypothetical protein
MLLPTKNRVGKASYSIWFSFHDVESLQCLDALDRLYGVLVPAESIHAEIMLAAGAKA